MVHEIATYVAADMTETLARAIAQLTSVAFHRSGGLSFDQRVRRMLDARQVLPHQEVTTERRFVIWDDKEVLAHARTFVRSLSVEGSSLDVLALASVCTAPRVRGAGLGVAVTQYAWKQVGNPGWPHVSLFQTPVPNFYEKIGCRPVENVFVNSTDESNPEANPWRDPHVMIFPASFAWPHGCVDLKGPDY